MSISEPGKAWRDACRRAVKRQEQALKTADVTALADEASAGGDAGLEIDRLFETIALEEFGKVHGSARIISEEVGETGNDEGTWIVLDPIDGSKNIANGLPQFALSVAIADGPAMTDVWFAYVYDFGADEEFTCDRRGDGAVYLNGDAIESANSDPPAVLIAIESAEPHLVGGALPVLADAGADEIRVLGSIAIALCYLALGRVQGLVTCKQCRSVDAAAGHLIAAAAGNEIRYDGQLDGALDLAERYRLAAAGPARIEALVTAQQAVPLVDR